MTDELYEAWGCAAAGDPPPCQCGAPVSALMPARRGMAKAMAGTLVTSCGLQSACAPACFLPHSFLDSASSGRLARTAGGTMVATTQTRDLLGAATTVAGTGTDTGDIGTGTNDAAFACSRCHPPL